MPMIILLMALLTTLSVFASESDLEYRSAARMGMGGLSSAWRTDATTSMFNNPAFLSSVDSFSLDVINPTVDASTGTIALARKLPHPTAGNYYSSLSPYFGQTFGASLAAAPTVGYKGFVLIPAFAYGHAMAEIRDPVFSSADGFYTIDYGIGLGKGLHISDKVSVGLSAFYLRRASGSEQADITNAISKPTLDKRSGSAVTVNTGATYSVLNKEDTIVGIRLNNANGPQFWPGDDSKLSRYERMLSVGASSELPAKFLRGVRVGADIGNILSYDEHIADKLSLGASYPILSWLFVRGGMREVRPTAGLGINTDNLGLDIGYYQDRTRDNSSEYNSHVIVSIKVGINVR
jgi:hypothetical protein